MPPIFDAVIFDLDGTLIDTEALCNLAGVQACAALGLAVDLGFFEALAGIDDVNRVRLISAHVGAALPQQAFLAEWDRVCRARFADGIPLKPGAMALLDRLLARGMPLALATSSRRAMADEKLGHAGLARFFPTVVTFEDVVRPKPAPDAYLLAASRLGAAPAKCCVFEDSETGAQAAHAAGMTVVQVPDLHPTTGTHAHLVAASLVAGAVAMGLI